MYIFATFEKGGKIICTRGGLGQNPPREREKKTEQTETNKQLPKET